MPSIRISSAINGFRRAGVAHPSKPTVYPGDYFSDEQIRQLKAEPRLAVEFGDFEVEELEQADPPADQTGAVEPDSASGDVTPDNGENLLQPLMDIIGKLDPHDEKLWNKDGSPKAANFPQGTTAEDRANAWEMFQAQADKA